MRDEEIERLDALEATFWWHVGRRRILERLLARYAGGAGGGARALDLGCGTGRNLTLLASRGVAFGLERSERALAFARARGAARLARGDAAALPFRDRAFDLALALDVLEHLDDDRAGIRELARVLRPGGVLVVAVPAYRFLWSEHDEALGHRRRYVASELHRRLALGGFRVLKRSYACFFATPPILLYRLWRGIFPSAEGPRSSYVLLPSWLNALFAFFLALEGALMEVLNLPLGTSIFCVARREGGESGEGR